LVVTDRQRASCLRELRSWHTTALVLPDGAPHAPVIRDGADQILGPARHVADIWLWRV
jgi:hypothetical protein